jgi:hypothetical protein
MSIYFLLTCIPALLKVSDFDQLILNLKFLHPHFKLKNLDNNVTFEYKNGNLMQTTPVKTDDLPNDH